MNNTVDALKNLYKTLTGQDYAGDPNPTDAEMIDAIAKDASIGGGGGSGTGIVIKTKINMSDGTMTVDPLATGLSMTDLSDAIIESYVSAGDSEVLAGINKVCDVAGGATNVIQMTIVKPGGQNGLTPAIFEYNSDTGVVTFLGNGNQS